jgi:transposase-like protein
MRQKSGPEKQPAEDAIRDIRRVTRRHFSAEEKIRIVLEGLRGEESIAELCRREGIASSMYYGWSKEFLEADRKPPRIDPHGRTGSGTASQRLSGSQMVDLALDQPDSARGKWRCASRTRKNTLSQRLRSIGC